MTEQLQDPRRTILALMNVTRRQWQARQDAEGRVPQARGEKAAYAWPTGAIGAVRREGDRLARVRREQA